MLTFICVSKASSIFIKTIKISSAELRMSSSFSCFNPAVGWATHLITDPSGQFWRSPGMSLRLERAWIDGTDDPHAQHFSLCDLGQARLTRAAFPTNVPASTLEGLMCEEQLGEISWESSASRLPPGGQRTSLGICWNSHAGSESRSSTGKPPVLTRTWPTRSRALYDPINLICTF